jgi:hypothetical protein
VRRRFRFEQNDNEYGAFGEFGPAGSFSVVQFQPGSKTEMKVLAVLKGMESAEQLKTELAKKFPDLTGFRPF